MKTYFRQIDWGQDLMVDFNPISGMSVDFSVDVESAVYLTGYIDTHHRGLISGAVMVAFQSQLDGKWLPGSKTGANIINTTHHYASCVISGYAIIQPGMHNITLFGRSASSASAKDGLAEVKPLYNSMVVHVHEK